MAPKGWKRRADGTWYDPEAASAEPAAEESSEADPVSPDAAEVGQVEAEETPAEEPCSASVKSLTKVPSKLRKFAKGN